MSITVTLQEKRVFAPSKDFVQHAAIDAKTFRAWQAQAKKNPQKYWEGAAQELRWKKKWTKVQKTKKGSMSDTQWFLGGKLNVADNCLDRHVEENPNRLAILWEGEPGETVSWTYRELLIQVQAMTAGLRKLGLAKGDRVAIYMPLVPEAAVAMLACARAGLTHTVIFGGFSSEALKDRINDAQAKAVLTADGGYRKGAWLPLITHVDTALKVCPTVKDVVILKRADVGGANRFKKAVGEVDGTSTAKRHDWYSLTGSLKADEVKKLGQPEWVDSEHPLFILYTSGTTGKPKGIVHSSGGYLVGALRSSRMVFDLKPTDLYWCTADVGWITGHTYLVYGPLAAGASIFMYEGAPTTPTLDRFWDMIERHRITILYTAPTAIRAFMKLGTQHPKGRDLSSLRLLGSVGEPINPEAWMWYRENVGGNRCPIVDTFWQTETGSIVISPVPAQTRAKPGSATFALPGYDVAVVDKGGKPVKLGSGGFLVIRKPWPSMARTIHGDPERFKTQYFTEFPGLYFTGDGARIDKDGYIWCMGRVDDVLNVSGHRLGTMEIESALVSHPTVAEAAVVGRPDDLKGQAVVAFVTLKADASAKIKNDPVAASQAKSDLRVHVTKEIGALARPEEIRLTESLPKTRSGKIMRRLLRELAVSGQVKGDTTTLEDFSVIASLQHSDEE
ncbi:MAG: acetate--CoA ligase [Bdellovibrionales bacterium]|nr:acetate--CoA ligase [Bdellovibrionales bacterium]